MKRELKFRVWDNINYMSKPFTLEDIQFKKIGFAIDCPVMQFTGIMDKKGVEIYEQDLVKVDLDIVLKYIPHYSNHRYVELVYFRQGSFEVPYKDWPEKIEVIGNIYENPNNQ